ncbi:MAG: EAL domain-containing protein [Gammaproteobacteria bacterium]|nr:EAL domain-containing protein [Gammaproteobacteria bacterium]
MLSLNLRLRILLPLCLVSFFLLIVFSVNVFQQEESHIDDELQHSLKSVQAVYRTAIEEHAEKMMAVIEMIADQSAIKKALVEESRSELLALSDLVFQRLSATYKITHYYFHDVNGVNILRVHQPQRFGDEINRFTMRSSRLSGKVSYGIELGPLGTFTLRVVAPVYDQGKIIGYIELGEEVDDFVAIIHKAFSVEVIVAIDKQYLVEEDWKSGMRMLGRESDWDLVNNFVMVTKTLSETSESIVDVVAHNLDAAVTGNAQVDIDEHNYRMAIVPFYDVMQRPVGRLIVLRDMTARVYDNYRLIMIIAITALVIGVLLFAFFYWLLGDAERNLQKSRLKLQSSKKRLMQAQRMAHFANWEWDLQNDTLSFSDEMLSILGVTSKDLLLTFDELLNCVHVNDRDGFVAFINRAKNISSVQEYTHRIVHADNVEHTLQHFAQLEYDDNGAAKNINLTINDVTSQFQAEKLSARVGRILEHSWNEIYAFDAENYLFVDVSDGACNNLGYSIDELRAMTPMDIKEFDTRVKLDQLVSGLRRGKQSYLTYETMHQRKNGTHYPVEVRLQLSSMENPPVFIAIVQDISDRLDFIKQLQHKATHDELTGLPNRFLLLEKLTEKIHLAKRELHLVAVIIVDLIQLKEINDTLGHHNGDIVLERIALRLDNRFSLPNFVSRLDGNELAVVLDLEDVQLLEKYIEEIQSILEQPVIVEDMPLDVEVAMGIAIFPEHGETPTTLLQHADIAMRIAKDESKNIVIYDAASDPFSLRHLTLLAELKNAIRDDELVMYYQPKINVLTGDLSSVEALVRWPHKVEGMIPPNDFIPLVEQSGLIRPFTQMVLRQSVKQCRSWLDQGYDFKVAVNLSTRNLLEPDLAENIEMILAEYAVPADNLILEITESAVMSRPENALKILSHLHATGVQLSIDDFGTGYSSLAYLKRLPVNELKIDLSFVIGMDKNENDAVIVRSTIDLAHNLGLTVVAEGVENKGILQLLATMGCDTAQGYHLARPMPGKELISCMDEICGRARDIKISN